MTERNKSHDSRGPSPIIGTLSIPSVCNFTSLKSPDRHPMEVLGPAEYVWGLPVKVKIEEGEGRGHATPTTCRVLTMLYRRCVLVAMVMCYGYIFVLGFLRELILTLPLRGEGKT